MPYDAATPVPEPLPQSEQRKLDAPSDKWNNRKAFQIVRSDWAFYESYRTNAHDWRYRNSDELYLAWAGQRYWDGTRVPRSSLGIPVTFQQIEALLPKIVSALVNVDGYHFYDLRPGDDEDAELGVLAWKELVSSQLDEINWRMQVARAVKSMAQYGNGVLEVGVEEYEYEDVSFDMRVIPVQTSTLIHPIAGPIPFPTKTKQQFSRKVLKEKRLRPYVRYVSLKDFYVDPNCESPRIQDAGAVIHRRYMRAEQIKALDGQPGFKIPDDMYLTQLSMAKSTANADVTKLSAELFRYNMWNPSQDYTSDPNQKRIAVISYTTNDRKIWWLQGSPDESGIIYNEPNKYNEINYYSVPYADVLDRWHALSVCDVAEGEQRLQQAIINGRIDELALSLHRPMVKRRGVTIPAYQLKVRPGVVIETENPEGDIQQLEVQNITQQAFVEVAASDQRVQKTTGITDLAALGTPSAGGNSANRTAAGINTQAGATQDRVRYIVENCEDYLIEPVVNAVIRFDRKFLDLNTASAWLKNDPRFANLDPKKVMNMRIVAECRASKKMAARMGFLQVFPMLAQFLFNPEFLQLTAQVNKKKLNAKTVADMLLDAINYSPKNPLFEDMTPEDVQAMNRPPADAMIKAQTAQQQMASDQQINQNNLKTKLLDTLIKEMMGGHQKYSELDDKFILGLLQAAASAKGNDDDGGDGEGSSES